MSVVQDILNDELIRLQSLLKEYQKKLKKFPKGSVSIKTRGNFKYAYRAFRQEGRVEFEYIGKIDSDKATELKRQIAERKKIELLKKDVTAKIRELESAIRAG